jgi:Zn-dependent protease
MKLGGISILRINGIEIVVDYSWFVLFFFGIYFMAESYTPQIQQHYTQHQYWAIGAAVAVLYFFSILIHELVHSFVAMKHGIRITSIRLLIFGGISQVTSEPKTSRHEFLIALSGPATSMVLGTFLLSICSAVVLVKGMTPTAAIVGLLAFANIGLAILNMIPGFPLDGGRILRAFLWDHWGDMARATKVVSRIGNACALFLIVFGVLWFLVVQSPLIGLMLLFVGLFMKLSAAGSYQSVMLRQALSGVQVRQIMTENIISVDWLISITELVQDYIYKHQFTNYPVFNRDEFLGVVSLEGVKTIPKELWGFKQVRDIMTPIEMVSCLKPGDDVSEALSKMVSEDIDNMPVVEDGHLVGIISRRDIMNLFKIKSDLGVA